MLTDDNRRPASVLSCWSDETIVHKASSQITNQNLSAPQPCFVVKRLYRKHAESHREFVKRASGEYCIASVLSHINVVGALNLLMEDYNFCMVMDLIEMGDPLSVIIKSNHMTTSNIVDYFKQLVQATYYIQGLGIAHQNIQPENILLFPGGLLKLTGFGNAFVFRSPLQNHHLKSQGRVGSLAYQPPEVLLWWNHCVSLSSSLSSPSSSSCLCVEKKHHREHRRNHSVGGNNDQGYCASAVDIWSMGVVLLHMLQKQCLWSIPCQHHDPTYAQFITRHQALPVILSLPSSLRCLIYRMLDPNPWSRIDVQQLSTNL